jgi:hypothetical protein
MTALPLLEGYRFIRWRNKQGQTIALELYDHQADPKENVSIANLPENAELVKQLTAQFQANWKAARPQ